MAVASCFCLVRGVIESRISVALGKLVFFMDDYYVPPKIYLRIITEIIINTRGFGVLG